MFEMILAFHVLLSISLISLILLQQGKGADAGASFGGGGGGGSQTVFGSQGSASFLTRVTAVMAILFFATSLTLAALSKRDATSSSVTDQMSTMPPMKQIQMDAGNEGSAIDVPADVPMLPEK